jgi:hypothetical protein
MKAMSRKSFTSEVGKYRVQVTGKNVQIFYKKDDSVYEVRQSINIGDRQDLENLFTAIGSVIDLYSQSDDDQ